jgi:hypothetical protein
MALNYRADVHFLGATRAQFPGFASVVEHQAIRTRSASCLPIVGTDMDSRRVNIAAACRAWQSCQWCQAHASRSVSTSRAHHYETTLT